MVSTNPESDIMTRLWNAAGDELQRQPRLELQQVLDIARRSDLVVSWQDLTVLSELFEDRSGSIAPPRHLVEFLAHLAMARGARRVLDPFATSPTILAACGEATAPERALGLVPNRTALRTARLLGTQAIGWRTGDPLELLGRVSEQFDLVVSAPPLAYRPGRQAARLTGGDSVRGEYAWALLAEAGPRLADDGMIVMLTTESIHWRLDARRLQTQLVERDLYLNAVISVGAVLGTTAQLDLNLVVFSHEPQTDLWVGRLAPDIDPSVMTEAMLARRVGDAPELGRLVARESYSGWRPLVAREQWRELLDRFEGPVAELGSVATSVRTVASAKLGSGYEQPTNAVFLGEWLGANATLAPETDEGRSRTFIEIALDPERVQASYFVSWLNSRAGRLVREQTMTGAGMKRINAAALARVPVPVPPLAAQLGATEADRQLTELLLRAEQLREDLWMSPQSAPAALAEISGVRTGESFERWMTQLPFPIAVIAHHYHAGGNPAERVGRLLHFFEATAQFCAALLLSAVRRDPALSQALRPRLAQLDPGQRPLLERATFGSWLQLGQTAAKALRHDLNNAERRPALVNLFAAPTPALADLLIGKPLWRLPDVARGVRNATAHGGIHSPVEQQRQLEQLEGLLAEFRALSATAFDDVELVRPGQARIAGQTFTYEQAERLSGSNSIFVRRELRSVLALDDLGLYLVPSTGTVSNALPIVPLLVLRDPPPGHSNAVYFYSGRNRAGHYDFVSYHFGSEPTSEVDDPALTELLEYLMPLPAQ